MRVKAFQSAKKGVFGIKMRPNAISIVWKIANQCALKANRINHIKEKVYIKMA